MRTRSGTLNTTSGATTKSESGRRLFGQSSTDHSRHGRCRFVKYRLGGEVDGGSRLDAERGLA
jgi:hypothetical protein